MLQWLLPDYSSNYKRVWLAAVGFLIATTILTVLYGTCYADVARTPVFQGIPWSIAVLEQLGPEKHWNRSALCSTVFDVFNPAWVDGTIIALPANSLLLVSLLSQLVLRRNAKKIPEATIIGLLLMSVTIGCLIKGIHINFQLRIFSYVAIDSVLPGVFFGLYLAAFVATGGTVYLAWPVKDASDSRMAVGPEEIALRRLDGDNLPPMIRPMLPPDASSCDQHNDANNDGRDADSAHDDIDVLTGIF